MNTMLSLMTAAFLAAGAAPTGPAADAAPAGRAARVGPVPDTVRLIEMPEEGSPFIAFNFWVKAGSQNDPAGKEGLAALTAAMVADGSTRTRSVREILDALYPMAAGYTSSVDKEMTVFRGVVHRDNLEAYYGILREAILEPGFREEDFERIKARTMNFLERGRRYNRDEELSKELLYWMAYRGTPYEHPEEGYVESVASITLDDVRSFYDRYYRADNIVVAVGGGYPGGFARRVRADVDAARPTGEVPRVPAPEPAMPDGVKVLIVEKNTDATAISMGFPHGVTRADPDFWPLMLVGSWFGEHRSSFSHLYQVIRERRGMNYGDYAYIEPFPLGYTTQQRPVNYSRRSNLFEIWIRPVSLTSPTDLHDRALFATRAAWRELDRLVRQGLPDSQVDRTRTFLRNFSVTYGSTVSRRLAYAVDDAFYGLKPGFLARIRPELEALGYGDVDAAIRRHLQSGNPGPGILAEEEEIARFPIPVEEDDITIIPIDEVFQRGR